jgi:hypothetical protein
MFDFGVIGASASRVADIGEGRGGEVRSTGGHSSGDSRRGLGTVVQATAFEPRLDGR